VGERGWATEKYTNIGPIRRRRRKTNTLTNRTMVYCVLK